MPTRESLLKERLAQLDDISQRRNGLLRQLYEMIKGDQDVGRILNSEPHGEDGGLTEFLNQFDLKNDPNNGSIMTLPDTWFQLQPSAYSQDIEEPTSLHNDREYSPQPHKSPLAFSSRSSSSSKRSAVGETEQIPRDRHSRSRSKSVSTSPRNYSLSPEDKDPPGEVDLTGNASRFRTPSPLDPPRELVPEHVPQSNLLFGLEYESDDDESHARASQQPTFDELLEKVAMSEEIPVNKADLKESQLILNDEETGTPPENLTHDLDLGATVEAQNSEDNQLDDQDVVPSTPTPEFQDSTNVTPPPPETEHPFDPRHYQDDRMELSELEDIQSSSSAELEPNSPRTPSPLPSVLVALPSSYATSSRPTIRAPSPIHEITFNFDDESIADPPSQAVKSPSDSRVYFNPHYSIPLLNSLPPEFHRKKSSRQQRKRDKDKDRGESSKRDDWIPLGMNKWRALLRANPTWKHVSKSSKSLSTKDWNVALTELRLIRTFDRIEMLKDNGRWSFRQPKKQRGVGGLVKTHWDYLMDEMKWMRIDFREERKWKIALAYTLVVAVQEWHAAGTVEERVRRGICVIWPKTRLDDASISGIAAVAEEDVSMMAVEEAVTNRQDSMQMGDYGSDDGSDDDQDKEQGDVVDPLDTNVMVQDELAQSDSIKPKIEDVDDFPLQMRAPDTQEQQTDVDTGSRDSQEGNDPRSGLRPTSRNPLLQSTVNRTAFSIMTGTLREKIVYSDTTNLFLDLDELELETPVHNVSAAQGVADVLPSFPDLSALFPDLQPYGLLEVVPATIQLEGKKNNRRERDDPHKRTEDTTFSKLTPVSKFMHCRPTLLGPLQPSRHWMNDGWNNLDDCSIYPSDISIPHGSNICGLFDTSHLSLFESSVANPSIKPPAPIDPRRNPEPRDQLWTPNDDLTLKSLVELYHNNWSLIADALNTTRLSVGTDRRTAWDCYYRWSSPAIQTDVEPTPTVTNLSNRPKRHAAMTASEAAAANSNANPEPRKRRRHIVLQEAIRKVAKKRDAMAKAAANQKRQTLIHDTHGQYNKMPKLTPQELGRMKVEKDYQEHLARQRSEEMRAKALREQQARPGAQNVPQQPNGVARAASNGFQTPQQALPQIRSQVNISQQQRISNPMTAATGAHLSPQHQQAVQAQVRAMAAAQQAQVQAQAQAQGLVGQQQNGQGLNTSHLSPTLSYTNQSSSPSISQASPSPRAPSTSDTPAPSGNVTPRPPSTQPQPAVHPNPMARAAVTGMPSVPHYYGNMNMSGQQFTTTEQMEQALRLQNLIQAHQRQQIPQVSPPSGQLSSAQGGYPQ